MLDSLPKHSEYAQRTKLRNKIMKKQNYLLHCIWINHHEDLLIKLIV